MVMKNVIRVSVQTRVGVSRPVGVPTARPT